MSSVSVKWDKQQTCDTEDKTEILFPNSTVL